MPTHRRNPVCRLLVLAASLGTVGCGAEAYQGRIEGNSIPFFHYQREVESNLGPRWRSANGTVSLRLPPAFKEVAPPKKKKDGSPATVDPRIPPDFNADLPGLLGGFRGKMKAEAGGGKTTEVPVYAFVLTNQFLLNSRDPKAKPLQYDQQLVASLGAGLAQRRSAADFRQYSATDGFRSTPDLARAAEFSPDFRFDRLSFEPSSDVPMEWQVYIRRLPKLHVAVVYAVPKTAARDEQLRKRIDLSLQSLRIEPASGAAGAAAPAPSSGGTAGPAM